MNFVIIIDFYIIDLGESDHQINIEYFHMAMVVCGIM